MPSKRKRTQQKSCSASKKPQQKQAGMGKRKRTQQKNSASKNPQQQAGMMQKPQQQQAGMGKRKRTQQRNSASKNPQQQAGMMQKPQQQQAGMGKRKRTQQKKDNGEDIISSLTEAILHHILSFLDMKHAVQTTILSKRWRNLWTSLGSLTFNSELFHLSPNKNRFDHGFLDFVDQVLLFRGNSDIQKFHLINNFNTNVIKTQLIISVIRRNVVELNIDFRNGEIPLPKCLFSRNSLTKLVLSKNHRYRRWSIDLHDTLCLPNLVCLHLYSVSFHDEYLTNKFLSCPNLEELIIHNVEFLNMNVNIHALKLKELVVKNLDHCYGDYGQPGSKFKLYAPNLTNLTCEDYMFKEYTLENLSSLVKADIHMQVEAKKEDQNPGLYFNLPVETKLIYAQGMMQCLEAFLYVRSLKLQAPFLEVISGSSGFLECQPSQLCDLTCLRLETWLSWNTIRSITYLFNISPNLKSLFLKISEIKSGSEYIRKYPEVEVSLQCLLDKLECVEIRGAVGDVNELKFLEILLKNAKVLKKLVVYTSKVDSPNIKKRLMEFTRKVLTFPSVSSDIKILVF